MQHHNRQRFRNGASLSQAAKLYNLSKLDGSTNMVKVCKKITGVELVRE